MTILCTVESNDINELARRDHDKRESTLYLVSPVGGVFVSDRLEARHKGIVGLDGRLDRLGRWLSEAYGTPPAPRPRGVGGMHRAPLAKAAFALARQSNPLILLMFLSCVLSVSQRQDQDQG
jgi:hypothetical protein